VVTSTPIARPPWVAVARATWRPRPCSHSRFERSAISPVISIAPVNSVRAGSIASRAV